MDLSQSQQELIEKYLSNTLSQKDQILFDNASNEAPFKAALLEQTELLNAIEVSQDKTLKEKLRSLDSKQGQFDKSAKSNNRSLFRYLAIALFLIFAGWVIWSQLNIKNSIPTNQELFAQHYQAFPAERNQRGTTDIADPVFEQAMDSYDTGNYAEALNLLNSIESDSVLFDIYKANCFLELNKLDESKDLFEQVLISSDKVLRETAEWYLCLIKMKQANNQDYKQAALKISENPSHTYQSDAQKLLGK